MWHRLELTGYCDLEARRPGAVAHMSLHQKPTMSKSRQTLIADSECFPDLHRGTGYPFMLATERGGRLKPSAPRRWRSSRRALGFGQRLFAILFRENRKTPDFCGFQGAI